MESMKCPKCSGNLETGFIADFNVTNVLPSVWVEGDPEHTFWTGEAGAKISGKVKRRVQTHRCTECGYLESFATAQWPGA